MRRVPRNVRVCAGGLTQVGLTSLVKVDSSGTSVTIFPKANCGVSCAFTPRSAATANTIIPKRAAAAVAFLAFILTVIIIILVVVVVAVVASQSVPPLSRSLRERPPQILSSALPRWLSNRRSDRKMFYNIHDFLNSYFYK